MEREFCQLGKFGERLEALVGDPRPRKVQIVEFGKSGERFQTGVGHVGVSKGEAFKLLEWGEILDDGVRHVLAEDSHFDDGPCSVALRRTLKPFDDFDGIRLSGGNRLEKSSDQDAQKNAQTRCFDGHWSVLRFTRLSARAEPESARPLTRQETEKLPSPKESMHAVGWVVVCEPRRLR